jgi:hypothetical protein
MSTTKPETKRHPVDHDIEIRIRDFRNLTIAALGNIITLTIHVGTLWFWIKVVPSTVSMSFYLRWPLIVFLYLGTIAKNASHFQNINAITRLHMSSIEDEKRSRNPDVETRTINLEDWILANFCAIGGLSTIGFVAWYLIEIIKLTVPSFFYWACTMGGLCSLFWLLKWIIRFYRKVKGIKHEEAGHLTWRQCFTDL